LPRRTALRPRHAGATPRQARPGDAYRTAYLAAGAAMARITLAGVIIDANPAFGALFGRPESEFRGRALFDLLHPDDAAALRAGRLSTLQKGRIRALLRFQLESDLMWGRTTITLARRSDDRPDSLVLTVEDVTAIKKRESDTEHLLRHDAVTGLPNANLFVDQLQTTIASIAGTDRQLSVILFEIGNLGSLRAGLGPQGVDVLLGQLAQRLRVRARPTDSVGRMGYNEFAIALTAVGPDELEAGVISRVRSDLEPEYIVDGSSVAIEIRIGVATLESGLETDEELLRRARLAMYLGPIPAAALPPEAFEVPEPEEVSPAPAGGEVGRRLEVLEPVSLFLSVPDNVLRRIARYLSEQTAGAGEDLIHPQSDSALRIIDQGVCEVRAGSEAMPLLTLGPGDFVGPDAMFVDNPVPIHVRALTDCRLLVLDEESVARTAPPGSAFREALRRAADQRDSHLRALLARTNKPATGSQRIAIYSTKGGSGRTTLALNLAAELGRRHPGDVLLVDLALPYNHAALMANLTPSTCLARLLQAADSIFDHLAWSTALPHPAGFLVLPVVLRPEEAELVTPQLLARARAALEPHFKYVIFDLGTTLDDCVLEALEVSDHLILVATPELTSMHDTRQLIDLATHVLRVPAGRVHAVLNHRSPHSAMNLDVVEQVLGQAMAAEFAYYGARPELTGLAGQLQIQVDPRGRFARSVRSLADHLGGEDASAGQSA